MAVLAVAYKRDLLVRDYQHFMHGACQVLSSDWQCWKHIQLLKGYATKEKGWSLKDKPYNLTSVRRVERSGDVLGFYSQMEAVLNHWPVHEDFQPGEYNYTQDPVKSSLCVVSTCFATNLTHGWRRQVTIHSRSGTKE